MLDETVFVVGGEEFTGECVQALYPHYRVVGNSETVSDVRRLVKEWAPAIVVVDGDGLNHPLKAAQAAAGANPDGMVFVVAGRPTPDLVRAAVAAGVREVLHRPLSRSELEKAVRCSREELRKRLGRFDDAEQPEGEERRGGRPVVLRQQVLAVYSPKGGVGKSTVALNLAAAYRAMGGPDMRVLLVECDPYGNLAIQLQWEGARQTTATWWDVEGDGAGLGWPVVQGLINRHDRLGIYILPRAANLVDALETDETVTRRILHAARRHFDVVVLDCSNDLSHDVTLAALQVSTQVLLVVTPDLPTLNRIAGRGQAGEVLESDVVGVDPQRLRVVLNRVPRKTDLPLREIVRRLPFRLGATIPEDPLVQAAAHSGKVTVTAWPASPFSREVRRLAGAVVPEVAVTRRGGLIGRVAALLTGRG